MIYDSYANLIKYYARFCLLLFWGVSEMLTPVAAVNPAEEIFQRAENFYQRQEFAEAID